MQRITDNVYTFTGLLMGRCYAIIDADGVTVIDTGLASAAGKILAQLQAAGYAPQQVKRILITHAHPDHIGGLPALHRATGARVVVGALDRAVTEGQTPIPRAERITPGLSLISRLLLLTSETTLSGTPVDQVVNDGDLLPDIMADAGGLQAIHTPGHSAGHTTYWNAARRIAFVGDTMMNVPPRVRLPIGAFTPDMAANIRSIRRIAALEPAIVCFGHGPAWTVNTAAQIRALVDRV